MTVSSSAQSGSAGSTIYTVVQDAAVKGVALNDQTVVTSGATFHMVDVDNTLNSVASYVKLYDVAGGGAVTPGTDHPNWIFKVDAAARTSFTLTTSVAFASGLKLAVATEGGTAGTTGAEGATTTRILVT